MLRQAAVRCQGQSGGVVEIHGVCNSTYIGSPFTIRAISSQELVTGGTNSLDAYDISQIPIFVGDLSVECDDIFGTRDIV